MPRSSITGTGWQDAWGTLGTQSMQPSPHIEGLAAFAQRIDDRVCFLAAQQTDTVFSENGNKAYQINNGPLVLLDRYHIYYNGRHPQLVFGFGHSIGGGVYAQAGTYSVRFGDVDFGTIIVSTPGGTTCEWNVDIPDSFSAGEHLLKIYGATNEIYTPPWFYGVWVTFLPCDFPWGY
ncbi:MAG: hypothetical protein KOO60_11050 [Gemmatimonadales bacterium]|nr:hypothetical protein [Gemmatimonadales bacterium]